MDVIFQVIILILSVVVHEVAHGYAALMQGDKTAQYAGRLTLNPVKHLDIFGSIILPILLLIGSAGSFAFGWAKPVPYNPYNLRNQKWGELIVAIAGPISNLVIAFIFGMLIRFSSELGLPAAFLEIAFLIVVINCVLAVFNMIPVPPLDGSKVLFSFIGQQSDLRRFLERYSMILLLLVIFVLWDVVFPIAIILIRFFAGPII